MTYFFRLLLLFGCLAWTLPTHAQQPAAPTVSGDFRNLSFEEFARQIEAATPYRFFFDPAAVDSIRVTVQANAQPLATVLEQALAATKLHYAIDERGRVFVTAGPAIETALPLGFFDAGPATGAPLLPTDLNAGKAIAAQSAARVYEVGAGAAPANGRATLSGRLRDARTGEPVVGVAVYAESPNVGVSTDQFGAYALTLPVGRHTLTIRGLGVRTTKRQVMLRADGRLDIVAEPSQTNLNEVVVQAGRDRNVASLRMGVEKLDISTIKQVPTAFGEADILRVILTLPGVKSVGEGSTGMSVRGGGTDQNLVLFNDATIYNPSHLFGFFSAFNPDVLKSVELYKGSVPARYGGRLSSVLDIVTREGNKKKLAGAGGIGLLTSRLTLEGPLPMAKEKGSFIIGGRTSYSDWLLKQVPNNSVNRSAAGFYDLSAHLNYQLDEKNALYATGYYSRDQFRLASDTTYRYASIASSVKWRHTFNTKFSGVFTGTFSQYDYSITSERNPVTASEFAYRLQQGSAHADFSYFYSPKHTIEFGGSTLRYNIKPGELKAVGEGSLIETDVVQHEKAQESALYLSDQFEVNSRLSLSVGLRYSLFQALGPRQVNQYLEGASKTENTITDTVSYGNGDVLATYHGPEYRLSAKYMLSENSSVKLSLNRMRQYIHQLSNTTVVSPTDSWKLSDPNIRPQVSDQLALGLYRNLRGNTIETSVEVYYKKMRDFLDYKSGATLFLNDHLETDVVNAQGRAYGMELMVRKLTGKLNGWASYTFSRSLVQVNTPTEQINEGAYYPSNFDKPHDFTLVSNYRVSRRFNVSANFNYSTGRPITLPLAKYYIDNTLRVYYSDRNAYRVPDYYRMDLALNFEGNHKVKKLAHSSWTLAVYNVTGRRNPYSVYFQTQNGQINGYQLAIFGVPIPSLTYNFRF